MQTHFSIVQLADPKLSAANDILRSCVHCGFCTATCPTYVLLGDEADSPRGRIYLIKDMLENNRAASTQVVKHIDRCLSCLACMTTCPSGVHYMHLVDHARVHIEKTYQRPWFDRMLRRTLVLVLPHPGRFRIALRLARWFRFTLPILKRFQGLRAITAMLQLAPEKLPPAIDLGRENKISSSTPGQGRVALLTGCAQTVLKPSINAATIRLLNTLGIEVVVPAADQCCGSLVHHMGMEEKSLASARANIDEWIREMDGKGLDAIIVNTSGCGTTVKDYGYMLRLDSEYASKAKRVAEITRDISEYLLESGIEIASCAPALTVAYHNACSMQHGQQLKSEAKTLLEKAGFKVREIPDGHLCCGSAGVYNITQPEIANELRQRKITNIESVNPDVIATGNIGCIAQLETATTIPIVHTVELLDWAAGGPRPRELPAP